MIVQSACQPSSKVLGSKLRRPHCPRCGSVLLIAEESRFDAGGHIHHDWLCDDCGHHFVTSVRLGKR